MSSPIIHAKKSAEKYGGKPEEYMDIHVLMDSTKAAFSDARHRAISHNIWFCVVIIPKIFGEERTNSAGKTYCPKDIAEMHCIEDMGFVPTVQDFVQNMTMQKWMQGDANVVHPELIQVKPETKSPEEKKQTGDDIPDIFKPKKGEGAGQIPYTFPPDWQQPTVLD